ncbi:MAG: hypothetical protein WBZ29_16260 [Methanocella sp.]
MFGPEMPPGGTPASAPIELIDVVFALSNIRLVKEIVQDNLVQLDRLNAVGKGQTEGLKSMIVQKQQQALKDLNGVENALNGIVETSMNPEKAGVQQDVSLGPEHSRALIYALTFAITHLMKFMPQPGAGGGEIPGTII